LLTVRVRAGRRRRLAPAALRAAGVLVVAVSAMSRRAPAVVIALSASSIQSQRARGPKAREASPRQGSSAKAQAVAERLPHRVWRQQPSPGVRNAYIAPPTAGPRSHAPPRGTAALAAIPWPPVPALALGSRPVGGLLRSRPQVRILLGAFQPNSGFSWTRHGSFAWRWERSPPPGGAVAITSRQR